jgi:RNA polymerase-binding transcription factor DksA
MSTSRTLVAERARTLDLIAALSREIDEIIDSAQLANIDDEHDPDGSTVAYERAKATALLDAARHELEALDHAIARTASGTYGTCTSCGADIAPERLEALPAASWCIACARAG